MEHAWSSEHHHRAGVVDVRAIEWLEEIDNHTHNLDPSINTLRTYSDVLELKHVPLYESAAYFLIGPCDEELVIMVRLKGKPV